MKIFCEYNQEYDAFLKEAVQYTLDRYESQLELSNLEEIELVDKSKYEIETDGRADCDGKKIFVTSRLYCELPKVINSRVERMLSGVWKNPYFLRKTADFTCQIWQIVVL